MSNEKNVLSFNNKNRYPNYKNFEFQGIDKVEKIDDQKGVADSLREHLEREYDLAILLIEMEMYKTRTSRMDTKVQRYFNSTPFRNAFARFINYAYMVNIPYTIGRLATEMNADRKTISQTVKECDAEGWLTVDRSNGTTTFMGNEVLHDACQNYLKFRKAFAKNTTGRCFQALRNFEVLVSGDVSHANHKKEQ